jgi:hypothetical protein
MQVLRRKILNEWIGNTGDALNPDIVKDLYNLYDRIAFNRQISAKVSATRSVNVTFIEYERVQAFKRVSNLCNIHVYTEHGVTNYNIYISSIVYKNSSSIDDYTDVLIAFEHDLVHLLGILWGFFDSRTLKNDPVRGEHGTLYKCVAKSFFEETRLPEGISSVIDIYNTFFQHISPVRKGMYRNWENSCYLDSLLTGMLFMRSDTYRRVFFGTNVNTIEYEKVAEIDSDGKVTKPTTSFVTPCTQASQLVIESQIRRLSYSVQDSLFEDYLLLTTGTEKIKCTDIRIALSQCIPEMRQNGDWVMYGAQTIYGLIAQLFPALLLGGVKKYTYEISNPTNFYWKTDLGKFAFFPVSEYLSDAGEQYDWSDIAQRSNVIVFFNDGSKYMQLDTQAPEFVEVDEYVNKVLTRTRHQYEKVRTLGVKLKDSKIQGINQFELMSVVHIHGVQPHGEGGIHYTASINTTDGWMSYDDTGGFEPIELYYLRETLFQERNRTRPELFFYCKTT